MPKIIHEQDSLTDNDFLYPWKVLEVFHELNKDGYVNGKNEANRLRYIGGSVTYHLLDCSVLYEFNPGLGNFPRDREKITAYADGKNEKEKIENLENNLKERFWKRDRRMRLRVPERKKLNKITPVPTGVITNKSKATKPDTKKIKAFPSDSPYYKNRKEI
ncbi:MAG: hypothetical protein PVJ67_01490 [Candidatus Pacearchaeota archaeon]|jgi:hypothetical protein